MSYSTDKCLERVYGNSYKDTQKQEDGTAADLGAIPTGHKKDRILSTDEDSCLKDTELPDE